MIEPSPAIYVNAGLTVTLHDADKPTWEPECVPLVAVRRDCQRALAMHMRRATEMEQVIAALASLGRKERKAAGETGE